MAWQPDEEPLRQLAQCLKDSLSGYDQSTQKNAEIVSHLGVLARRPCRADLVGYTDAQIS